MASDLPNLPPESDAARVRELESRLAEAEETLEAIRLGMIDAVVIHDEAGEHRVYTLENADRPYRALIEQMQEGAATIAEDGSILYCNRRLAQMLDLPQESVIAQHLRRFVADGEAPTVSALLADAGRTGARAEVTLRSAGGRDIPVYLSLSLVQDRSMSMLCCIVTDLTEQKLHLRELAEANARLVNEIAERARVEGALRQAHKMEVIGQLTGGLAHDFNNMLQGVVGGIELALRRISAGAPEGAVTFLESARTAADRATILTRRLLGFGRRQEQGLRRVEVEELVRGMDMLIRQTVGTKVAVTFDLDPQAWAVNCDPSQLENALLNLAINARDAMRTNGRLAVETRNTMLAAEDTRGWGEAAEGAYVRITVSDNGVGMPPDILANAFEPFFTTKPAGQGSGLGLSQLQGFVRQSRGVVRIDSRPGDGTSVHLFLPQFQELGAVPAGQGQAAGSGGTAILAGGDLSGRALVTEALRELGLGVIDGGREAIGRELVQTVLTTPGRDGIRLLVVAADAPEGAGPHADTAGWSLADAARRVLPGLPILLITDRFMPANDRRSPGTAALARPFDRQVFVNTVQELIGHATLG